MKSRAYILEDVKTLTLREEECQWPNSRGSKMVLCKTIFSGISPGTETAAWRGEKPLRKTGGYPRKIGYQNVSVILDHSADIQNLQTGDLVYTNVDHRSIFVCHESQVLAKLPSGVETAQSYTFAYTYHMASCAIEGVLSEKQKNIKVAIFGGGMISLAIIELLELHQISYIVVSDSLKLFSNSLHLGEILTRKEFEVFCEVRESDFLFGIVCTNSWQDYEYALKNLLPGSEIVLVGFPGRSGALPSFNPFDPEYFYSNTLSVKTMPLSRKKRGAINDEMELGDSIAEILNLIEKEKVGLCFSRSILIDAMRLDEVYQRLDIDRSDIASFILDWRSLD